VLPVRRLAVSPTIVCSCLQVGQLLFYARVSRANRMLPFVTQIIDAISHHPTYNLSESGSTSSGELMCVLM
jgi:hypothetical protein